VRESALPGVLFFHGAGTGLHGAAVPRSISVTGLPPTACWWMALGGGALPTMASMQGGSTARLGSALGLGRARPDG